MTTQPPNPEAVEAANLKWESDTEVIGIYKFPCVRNKNGAGVILTGRPDTEVQQLAHLHNQAIDQLAAEVERLRARVAELEGTACIYCGGPMGYPEPPVPLPRPDKPGWWWFRIDTKYTWDACECIEIDGDLFVDAGDGLKPTRASEYTRGEWLPATPPPVPTQEASND